MKTKMSFSIIQAKRTFIRMKFTYRQNIQFNSQNTTQKKTKERKKIPTRDKKIVEDIFRKIWNLR